MTTTSITKNEELNEYAELLRNNGFTIIAPKESSTYYHFEKDNKFGYCQYDLFRGVTFTTVHKPCRECGTGFGMEYDRDKELLPLSVETALQTANTFAPQWASRSDVKAIRKYTNIADFISGPFRADSLVLTPLNS